MRTTTSLPLLAALGLLTVASPALAAPAKLSGGAVTGSGATTVKVANPNRYTLKGTVTLAAGKKKLASRKVSVRAKATKKVSLKLSKAAAAALKAKGSLAATMTAKLARPGHKAKSYRKALVLRPAGSGAPGAGRPGSGGGQAGGGQGGQGGGATGNRWTATTSMGGKFDLIVENGQVTLVQPTFQPVSCFKSGGYSPAQTSLSSEMFDKLGPWALGNQDATQTQLVPRVNTLVTSGERTVTYRLNTIRTSDQISGSMVQSFSDSRLEFSFPNPAKVAFISCAGTLNFTAVPAG